MQETQRRTWSQARASFKETQRTGIARAALELLLEGGSSEVTMSTVAERAGISRQTLYRYFADLNSVLAASVEGLGAADDALREWVLEPTDAAEQLHRLVDGAVEGSSEHAVSMEELLGALPPEARVAVRDHQQRAVDLVRDILSTLQAQSPRAYRVIPELDAPLMLGLISATTEHSRQRAHELIDRMTNEEEES